MNDMELAEEIERHLAKYPAPCPVVGMFSERWQQIIAALRRGPEPVHKNETFAEKVKRLQDARAQIDMELSELL